MGEDAEVLAAYLDRLQRIWVGHGSPTAQEIASRTCGQSFAMSAQQIQECLQGEAFPESSHELHVLLYGITHGYGRAWAIRSGESESEVTRVFQLWRGVTDAPEDPPTAPVPPISDDTPPYPEPALSPPPGPGAGETAVNHFAGDTHQGTVVQVGSVYGDVSINHLGAQQPDQPLHITVGIPTSETLRIHFEGVRSGAGIPLPQRVEVTVEAFTAQAVILRAMRAVVVSKRPPGRLEEVSRPGGASGLYARPVPRRGFKADLDAGKTVQVEAVETYESSKQDFPFSVTASDPEYLAIWGESTQAVHWHLELDWLSAGRSGTIKIDNAGNPFLSHPRNTI